MRKFVHRFIADARGATAIEYGLIAALLSLVVGLAAANVGTSLTATFQKIIDLLA